MAQNVTPRANPPGWRAEQALIECLEELEAQAGAVGESVRGINDETFAARADQILLATSHVLALHLPQPLDGAARDLEALERETDNLRVPRIDPALGERTDALDRLRSATGLLLRAIQDARRAAETAQGPAALAKQPVAIEPANVRAMLRRLDQVEDELKRIAAAPDPVRPFVQQSGLINFYVDKMRVKLDLARLHLTIDGVTFDLGALTSAVEAMGQITARFQAAVKAWVGRVSEGLTERTKPLTEAVLRAVRGTRTLGKVAVREAERERIVPVPELLSGEPEMVLIRPGTFRMGIPQAESKRENTEDWDTNARPVHTVTIPSPFLLGKYPVTRGEYAVFAQETQRDWEKPNFEQTDRHPAVNVSFEDAEAFAAWLSRRTGRAWRLPSEAEWEYACRAGTRTARHWGDKVDTSKANFDRKSTTEVDVYPPNPWGLHDMLGNVWEWTADQWHENYQGAPEDGSAWVMNSNPSRRVARGGSWDSDLRNCRAGLRVRGDSGYRGGFLGFRLARTL
jgi:formylglycine-generating enzyme required for sulfatase activity